MLFKEKGNVLETEGGVEREARRILCGVRGKDVFPLHRNDVK